MCAEADQWNTSFRLGGRKFENTAHILVSPTLGNGSRVIPGYIFIFIPKRVKMDLYTLKMAKIGLYN